ncbi:MAG: hypothetical protein JWN15_1710 [Firmicutes bacterium]|nr:hypothetical protein [Bacillota bacterium]
MTEFPHISTVVLRFLEWTLPQLAERQRRGDGVTGPGRLGAPVGWAEVPGGTGRGGTVADEAAAGVAGAGEAAAGEAAAADPADAVRAGLAQVGAHRLMAAAQDRVRRRLVALAGAPLGRTPAGTAASPTGMAGWPGPGTAWAFGSAGTAWAFGSPETPGADVGLTSSQPAPDQAMLPTVRLPGAPSPSHAVRRAEPNSDARVAQLQAFSTPEGRLRGAVPEQAPAPGTAWAPGSAGAPGAAAAPTFSPPAPNQAMPPTMRPQSAPDPRYRGPQAEPNSDARVAERQAFSTPEARLLSPNVPAFQALDPDTGTSPQLTAPHTTPAPHIHPAAPPLTPNLPAQSRLLAEAQLRQMLADIIRADALRHGLNLKER